MFIVPVVLLALSVIIPILGMSLKKGDPIMPSLTFFDQFEFDYTKFETLESSGYGDYLATTGNASKPTFVMNKLTKHPPAVSSYVVMEHTNYETEEALVEDLQGTLERASRAALTGDRYLRRNKRSTDRIYVLVSNLNGVQVVFSGHQDTFNYMSVKKRHCPTPSYRVTDQGRNVVRFCDTKIVLSPEKVNRTHIFASVEGRCRGHCLECQRSYGCAKSQLMYIDETLKRHWHSVCGCVVSRGGPTLPP